MDDRIKWKDVPASDVLNAKTSPIGDVLDAAMRRLDSLATEKLNDFMSGKSEKMPDQVFMTDLRTAIAALSSLRKHV
jgi:hypothetical protein